MIEVFRKYPGTTPSVVKVPNWDFINRGIKENIKTVENYYKNNVRPVRSDHFLLKLLQSLPVSKTLPLYKYYDSVDSIALNHSMVHKLTSSIYKGTYQRGVFYGGIIPEIMLATDESFDVEYVDKNWRDISAVQPLLHPKSDMKYMLPNGVDYSDEFGLAVILINVTMLAVQYRAWWQNEMKVRPDNPYGTAYFISAFVLPNMIKQNTEIALFNRYYNTALDIKFTDQTKYKHPFAVLNYEPHLDHVIKTTLDNISKSDKSFRTVFSNMPAIYKDNLYQSLIMPEIFENRQVSWALTATRLRMINYLIKVSGDEAKSKNAYILNQTMNSLRLFDTYNMFKNQLPLDVFFTLDEYVDNIFEVLGSNANI